MNKTIPLWRTFGSVQAYCMDDDALFFRYLDLSPDEWLVRHGIRLKIDRKRITSLVHGPDGKIFFVKQFRTNRIWYKLRSLVSIDHACRIFRISQTLSRARVPVPAPLAVIRTFKSTKVSVYFISEALTEYITLEKKVKQIDQQSIFKEVMTNTAWHIAKMHSAGFYHGDMKWKNILIHPEHTDKIYFTDLDSVGALKNNQDKRYAMDISRFCISLYESLYNTEYIFRFIMLYSSFANRNPEIVIEHVRPYHNKRARKHKFNKNIDIPEIVIKT